MSEFQHACRVAQDWRHEMPPWANAQPQPPPHLSEITQRAIDIYLLSKQPNGEMGGIGWWQTANGYTAITLHDLWAGTTHNYQTVADLVKQCERSHHNLINEFNDDTLWWALLCVHLYTLGGDRWFLDQARAIWRHIHTGRSVCGRKQITFQDHDMEGGCFWTTTPDEGQVNSISTGLYAELSARLALVDSSDPKAEKHPHLSKLQNLLTPHQPSSPNYLEAARCSLGWILRCRYRPDDGIVLDGIKLHQNEPVDWAFTYTTAVPIGTCALLYRATLHDEYLTLACHIAHRAMRNPSWVEPNGVLTEAGAYGKGNHDPGRNDDAVGFKSVLVRHLAILYEVVRGGGVQSEGAQRTAALIRTFVNLCFEALVERNTNGRGQYGPWWDGPFEMPTSHSQMAVLDVMAAVEVVNRV
ncbi:hypothetical protein EJ03DRAFT_153056 [Teratosphaeria nubilosa]|uniref:Six-hairpin glycosidase n=1 Tax=Teratosphaeria nubilosa TaxID=161662 RepID=A0A6G1LKI1_9PEZI|nr:hypothetical protein EJ03DRAFT_153056 [Teratosphaeria nubilosa]